MRHVQFKKRLNRTFKPLFQTEIETSGLVFPTGIAARALLRKFCKSPLKNFFQILLDWSRRHRETSVRLFECFRPPGGPEATSRALNSSKLASQNCSPSDVVGIGERRHNSGMNLWDGNNLLVPTRPSTPFFGLKFSNSCEFLCQTECTRCVPT